MEVSEVAEKVRAFILEEFPSREILFKEAPLRINHWGFRDKEYEKHPPPGTFRAALLGSSTTTGSGVSNDETFEALVEKRLNATRPDGAAPRYEILNFGVAGRSLLQHVYVFEKQREAGIDPQSSTLENTRRLTPFIPEIISWGYRRIAQTALDHGITPVWVGSRRCDKVDSVKQGRDLARSGGISRQCGNGSRASTRK